MGYQGPYPAPPHPRYRPGLPPRQRAGKSATTLIVIGALLVTLGGVGILGEIAGIAARNVERPHSPGLLATDTSMRVGECISEMEYLARIFSSQPGNDCANESNTFELAFKDESTILCFALNLKQGECYHWNRDGEM
jgi:hypothetical protein